jgi:histidinol-phosphatase (PHP family)
MRTVLNQLREPLLYESHMHTPLCGHAVGEPEEYAARAYERGLKGIIVTCHGPTPFEWGHCMARKEWPQYVAIVQRARETWAGKVDVRLGIECDFMPGMEEWWREFLPQSPLNHVLGSVHPQVGDYRARYFNGDILDYQRTYFEHLALAAETGLFDTLSHPDLVKNNAGEAWDVQQMMPDILRALDRIAATGVAMELNTSGLNKTVPEMNPGPEMLREMSTRSIPVVVGADAHLPQRAADKYEEALDMLREAGYSEVSFFLERERHNVTIETARASLHPVTADGAAIR